MRFDELPGGEGVPDFTLIADRPEDPNFKSYSNTTDHFGDLIRPGSYSFAVTARNWVGFGEYSKILTIVIPYLADPDLITLTYADTIKSGVTTTVSIDVQN
jgi:hypothetical protein